MGPARTAASAPASPRRTQAKVAGASAAASRRGGDLNAAGSSSLLLLHVSSFIEIGSHSQRNMLISYTCTNFHSRFADVKVSKLIRARLICIRVAHFRAHRTNAREDVSQSNLC